MYKKYVESINAIEKITQDFGEFPSIPEWNKYAKEKDLLNSESIKYISGLNWHDLRNRTISRKRGLILILTILYNIKKLEIAKFSQFYL